MKKQKIFGIGAAVLMILLAVAPVVSSAPRQTSGTTYTIICYEFFEDHQTELDEIETYLSGIDLDNPPEEFPAEIQAMIDTLVESLRSELDGIVLDPTVPTSLPPGEIPEIEVEKITEGEGSLELGDGEEAPSEDPGGSFLPEPEEIPSGLSGPVNFVAKKKVYCYDGQNQYWKTSEPIEFPSVEDLTFIGHCVTLDNVYTTIFRDILEDAGVAAALVFIIAIASLAPGVGVLLGIWFSWHIAEILALFPEINQGYGIRFWYFDAVGTVLNNIFYIDAQPSYPVILPWPWVLIYEWE